MIIDGKEMPNPILILVVFGFALATVRILTTLTHELGHAFAGLLFLKGDCDVYIGTYGNPDKGKHFKLGRIKFHIVYDPLMPGRGVFISEEQDTTHLKNFLITLGGPMASLFLAALCLYIPIFTSIPETIQIAFYIFSGLLFMISGIISNRTLNLYDWIPVLQFITTGIV